MERFVTFTLRQRVVFNLLFVLLMVVGTFILFRMPLERYPNIQFGKMFINTFLPGASPEEVEVLVTRKIEETLEELDDVEFVRSSSYRERSNIVIKFTDDSDYEQRFNDVRLKVLASIGELPDNAEPPVFNFLDVNDWFPTISVNVSGEHSNHTLSLVAEELKILLLQIDGVKEVKLRGNFDREYHLLLDRDRLRRYGVTYPQVAEALRLANTALPGGQGQTGQGEFAVKVDEQFTGREDVFDTVVRRDGDGSFVRVGDVAGQGYFSFRDPYIKTSVNDSDCVTLQVLKDAGGNTLFIADNVREVVEEASSGYKEHGVFLTVSQDSSTRIEDSVRVLGVNLVLGVILVCLIIWLFMGARNAALTTVGIPFAFLVTILLMYLTGNSVNEVSLFAFVLVSGIIVDDAIVVVENIYRHRQEGRGLIEAVTTGTAEVFLPVVSATLTTVVAFLPMLIMTGMVGDFFAIVPKTICFALAASLFECLFVLPCHYLDFGPGKVRKRSAASASVPAAGFSLESFANERIVMRWVRRGFHYCIVKALRFRLTSMAALGILFICGMVIFIGAVLGRTNLVRIKFFPDNYSMYYAEIVGPPGTSLETTHSLVKEIAGRIMERGEGQAESALGFAGYYINEDFSPEYGVNLGYVAVTLPSSARRRFVDYPVNDVVSHLDTVRRELGPLVPPGFRLSVRPEKDGPPTGKDINIRVLGKDPGNVRLLGEALEKFLRQQQDVAPWLLGLQNDHGAENTVFQIRINSEKAAELDLSVTAVAELAASALEGRVIGEMKLPEEMVDIRLKLDLGVIKTPDDALAMVIRETPEGVVRLSDVCSPYYRVEPGIFHRFQNQRAITITANLRAGSPVSVPMIIEKVEKFYAKVRTQYPGATLNFAGEYESTQKSFTSLAYAFGLAIIGIYLILAGQFRSYLQPLIIIAAVIFGITGVIYGTVISRTLFTVNSFVALVGVTGVVVNDSLVLVEFINKCHLRGYARREALLLATHIRLRPILLTTLTTTLGLLPIALGIPEYSTIWGSMAMTFVTGLCTATFLTIIIIPLLWDVVTGPLAADGDANLHPEDSRT